MTSVREARVSFSESDYEVMGVEELVSICFDAGLRDVAELDLTGTGGLVQIEVEERLDEATLDDLAYVSRWAFVSTVDGGYLYIVGFVAPELPEEIADHADELVGIRDPTVDDHGTTVSLVGSQEAIRRTIRASVDAGLTPDLLKLGAYDGAGRPLDELTDRQREVLRTAYERGYYEVPRAASTEDVATALDVDPSTVAEHLQRAERNLLSGHLASG